MIARYSRPAMARVWSEERKLELWLEVELAALDAWVELGAVPIESARRIRERATAPTPERVAELEQETGHDLAAFVDAVASELGDAGRFFHYGLTSSDVVDTALTLQVQHAGLLLLEALEQATAAVVARAEEHRHTLTIGRTHGVHAEPTTFGLKLAGWAFELDRLSADILDALSPRLAQDAPKKLRFAVGPIPEPAARESSTTPASAEPPEPTSEEVATAASAAAEIDDPELRELAARAARASLAKARSGRRF